MHTIQVKLTNGKPIEVSLIRQGEPYGRSAVNTGTKELVDFRVGWGCFQYYLETILERGEGALCLHGGYRADSTVDAATMKIIRDWLANSVKEAA